MLDPEAFAREMVKLFGKSSKQVVMVVFDELDEGKILADKAPEVPKYQPLVDAINRADERKAVLEEMRETDHAHRSSERTRELMSTSGHLARASRRAILDLIRSNVKMIHPL